MTYTHTRISVENDNTACLSLTHYHIPHRESHKRLYRDTSLPREWLSFSADGRNSKFFAVISFTTKSKKERKNGLGILGGNTGAQVRVQHEGVGLKLVITANMRRTQLFVHHSDAGRGIAIISDTTSINNNMHIMQRYTHYALI